MLVRKESVRLANFGKGFANPRRVMILSLLADKGPQAIDEISSELKIHYKTLAVHIQRLERSGLVIKKFKGPILSISISPRGRVLLSFLRKLE